MTSVSEPKWDPTSIAVQGPRTPQPREHRPANHDGRSDVDGRDDHQPQDRAGSELAMPVMMTTPSPRPPTTDSPNKSQNVLERWRLPRTLPLWHPFGQPWTANPGSANAPAARPACPRHEYRVRPSRSTTRIDTARPSVSHRSGQTASASTRFVDVMYPYPVRTHWGCGRDYGPLQVLWYRLGLPYWHGATSVINGLAAVHRELAATNMLRVDLRPVFGDNPTFGGRVDDRETLLQLTRLYGYPHPTSQASPRSQSRR